MVSVQSIFTGEKYLETDMIWNEYQEGKQTYSQLAKKLYHHLLLNTSFSYCCTSVI